MSRMSFRAALLRVSDQLTNPQLENLKFLSRSVITNARMEKIRQPLDLFSALEERGMLSIDYTDFLHQLLESAGYHEARMELAAFPASGNFSTTEEFLFYECLARVSQELTSKEFDDMKFFFKDRLRRSTHKIFTATELFQLLIQMRIVTSSDLKALHDVLIEAGRRDLCAEVNQYMVKIQRQPYQQLHGQGGPPPNTLYTAGNRQGGLAQPVQATPENGHPTITSGMCTESLSSSTSSLSPLSPKRAGSGASTLASTPGSLPDVEPGFTSRPVGTPTCIAPQGDMRSNIQDSSHPSAVSSEADPNRHAFIDNSGQSYSGLRRAGFEPHSQSSQPKVCEQGYNQPAYTLCPQPPQNPARHITDAIPPVWFEAEESRQQSLNKNQELQKELARKDCELRRKEDDIRRYEFEIENMRARMDSATDQLEDKEREYQQQIASLQAILKQMTTEAQIQRQDMQKLYRDLQMANPHSPQEDSDFYKMDKGPHGICLIINNYEFHHQDPNKQHPTRNGANVDVHNLSQTFSYLRYKVEIKENLSSGEMQKALLDMANREHTQYDSFICCILTHGEAGVVHGSDCEPVNLNDLAGVMKICPSLYGKPKIFFIQACRGDNESKGFEVPERDTGGGPYHNTIPQEADFYFGFATPTGSSAYRSRRYGSWFISEVCQVFIKHAYTHDLGAMMVKVNKRVSDAYTKDGYKQSPESVNRLRFQVHFFRFVKNIGTH